MKNPGDDMTGAAETVVNSFWNQERAVLAPELTMLGGNGPVKDRVATRRLYDWSHASRTQ